VRGRLRTFVWKAIVLTSSLVEVPLFLVHNRELFRNRLLFPFWHWSFGHTVTAIDYAARLYWPHRISLLYLPHPNANPLVPHLFAHNVDVFTLRSRLPFRSADIDLKRFAVLRFFTLLLAGLRLRHYAIERLQLYRTLSLAEDRLLAGRPDTQRLESVIDYTGYTRLLEHGIGRDARLPADVLADCEARIARTHPDFSSRPFVTIVLRRKGAGLELHTANRDAGPPENYLRAVRWLTENGFSVVLGGDTDPTAFRDLNNVYKEADLSLEPQLANVFALTRCALFVGQQSGASVLANASGVLCLLVDA
jgi:hypothetical protein